MPMALFVNFRVLKLKSVPNTVLLSVAFAWIDLIAVCVFKANNHIRYFFFAFFIIIESNILRLTIEQNSYASQMIRVAIVVN